MPPRISSRLAIFNDLSTTPSKSTRSSKRKRAAAAGTGTETLAPPQPKHRRSALGEKSANSTDGSIRVADKKKHLDTEPVLSADENAGVFERMTTQEQEEEEMVVPEVLSKEQQERQVLEEFYAEAFKKGGKAHAYISKRMNTRDLKKLYMLVGNGMDSGQEVADLLAKMRCWHPDLLTAIGTTAITTLDLSSDPVPADTFILPELHSTDLLDPFFLQGAFEHLTYLTFRNTRLLDDDLALLRVLPSLTHLDLGSTCIGTDALHHLVCHRPNLSVLNLAHNPRIDGDARVALRCLTSLTGLYLRGTTLNLHNLRKLAFEELPAGCRLLSVPAEVIEHFNSGRGVTYAADIPAGYMQAPDGDRIARLTIPALKRNLELHAEANSDVSTTGSKVEMVDRLRKLLWNRLADQAIIRVLGKEEA